MKRKPILLFALIFIALFTTTISADTLEEKSDRVVTDMNITFGRSVGLLTPLDRRQEDNILNIVVAPFDDLDRIDIYAEVHDQYGYAMRDEDIIWNISCSLDKELSHIVFDQEDDWFNLVILYTDVTSRVITITAKSYSNPSVYITTKITVAPHRANLKETQPHVGRLYGGYLSVLTVPIFFINTPDGRYPATLTTLPRSESGIAHDLCGISVIGNWETGVLEASGTITVVNGIAELIFLSYNTPKSHLDYWVWMTLEVDMGELGVASTMVQIAFAPILDPPPPPAIAEVTIQRDNITIQPDFGDLITSARVFDLYGHEAWDSIEWSAEGLDEDDYLHWIDLNHFLHIGPGRQKRTITLTATAICNPDIYDSIEITVDPNFVQEVNEILAAHSRGFLFENAFHITRPANYLEWVSIIVNDQYGINMPLEALTWIVDSEVDSDKIIMFSWGFYLHIGAEAIEREITISAVSDESLQAYTSFTVFVDPSLPTLGIIEATDFEGRLIAGRAGSTTITFSSPYLPDGTYRAMLLSLDYHWMRWDATNMSFENGRALPWGDITFTDGNATITLNTTADSVAGQWDIRLLLTLPDELRYEYSHPSGVFTLTVE